MGNIQRKVNILFGLEKLEPQEIFRNLVTNKYMPYFDYINTTFCFQTLFYQSSFSYCCCMCGYEHEYVEYISENGDINEEMYTKILENVLNGRCPHVKPFHYRKGYTRETKIRAIHIAAAANTELAWTKFSEDCTLSSAIFQLHPFEIAVIKNNGRFLQTYQEKYKAVPREPDIAFLGGGRVKNASRSSDNRALIKFEVLTQLDFCIRKKNKQLMKSVLDPGIIHGRLDKTLEKCFEDPLLDDMVGDVLGYLEEIRYPFRVEDLAHCAVSAIAYEQDCVLRKVLDMLKSCKGWSDLTPWLPNICDLFGKHRQKAIVKNDYCYKGMKVTGDDHFHLKMLHYLRENHSENFFDQIKTAFDACKAIDKVYDNMGGLTPLHCRVGDINPRATEVLLRLGAAIDILNDHGETPLTQLLRHTKAFFVLNVKKFRETLTLLLFENPDVVLSKSAVLDGIHMDEFFMKRTIRFALRGCYEMDASEHSVFPDGDSYALNFIAPMLIECGFPYSRDDLTNALDKQLESSELNYFRHYLDNPRSLQLSCRDTLRKHFKNRAIHSYLYSCKSAIPQKICDFILIQDIIKANHGYL